MVTTLAYIKQLPTPIFKIHFKQLKLLITNYFYLKCSPNLESDEILALGSSADCRAALGWIACVMACSYQAWSISTLNNGQIHGRNCVQRLIWFFPSLSKNHAVTSP